MKLSFRIKHYFFSAFREIFVHHHGSLEFRAKIFALVIAANEKPKVENFILVKELATKIYEGDEDRANLLLLTTKELVEKVKKQNTLDLDFLVATIQKELKIVPRYAKKIDVESLRNFLAYSSDDDTLAYQENILEFLEKLKEETLQKNNSTMKE
jgi:electron transfer flavoprotein alpha subunit